MRININYIHYKYTFLTQENLSAEMFSNVNAMKSALTVCALPGLYLHLTPSTLKSQNYLSRNFYNLRFLALFIAFALNFILLFYKVCAFVSQFKSLTHTQFRICLISQNVKCELNLWT